MAGFTAETKPLASSRTVKGVAVTAAAVVAEATGIFQPEDVATAVTAARAFGFNEFAEALPQNTLGERIAPSLFAFSMNWDGLDNAPARLASQCARRRAGGFQRRNVWRG